MVDASRILWISARALAEDLPSTLFWLVVPRLSKHTLLILDIERRVFDLNTGVCISVNIICLLFAFFRCDVTLINCVVINSCA